MNEIEKMYENAGVEPEQQDCCKIADKYWAYETESSFEYLMQKECPYNQECTDECEYAYDKVVYSPFTAEKQLELIKFITSLGVCEIKNWNDKGFHFAIKRESIYPTMFLSLSNINLQETLADVINNLWQDLTEEEHKQIKEILE